MKAIKENGYHWNKETKTLKTLIVPKFKVGDRVRNKKNRKQRIITNIHKDCYEYDNRYILLFENQDNYELVPDKFDISTLVPFETKVLVREDARGEWIPAIWGFYDDNTKAHPYVTVGGVIYKYLIPFEGNEHLLGKTNDCNKYYKTWEE